MSSHGLRIAFFGSSLVSAYGNGAATYYRGIIRALHARGHRVTFYEPEAQTDGLERCLEDARGADVVVKASGVGVFDELLEARVLDLKSGNTQVIFWDMDAPATLARMEKSPNDPFRALVPRYDRILTYGGGDPVVLAYKDFGARDCVPIYSALDPDTHHPVEPDPRFECDLALLDNRLPDRERRVESFFLRAADLLPDKNFLLGGNGWGDRPLPANVKYLGHVYPQDHNALNRTARAVLNISSDSMARFGFSPATGLFEAAGAASCIITDRWQGIELFLEPGTECLVAEDGLEVAEAVLCLTDEGVRQLGQAARRRVLAEHTYGHRAVQLEKVLGYSAVLGDAARGQVA
jgi:spore maturation protein CgeB